MALKLLGSLESSGGNVGIGTSSPSKTLHVYSGTDNEGIFMEGTGNGHWFNFKSGTSNLWSMGAQAGLMGWYNRTDSTYKMVIADAGNVGIGTTSPGSAFKLDVNGYIKANSRIYVRDSTKTLEFGTDYIQSYVTSGTGVNPIRFFTGTTEKTRIDGNGNVGIGTTAPLEKLHVVGKINSSNNIVSNSTYTMFTGRSSRTVDDYGGLNKEYFKANLVTAGPDTTGEDSAHGLADLRFQLANSAGNTGMSDIMTLRSGGNVGIGTATPAAKLTVAGTIQTIGGTNNSKYAQIVVNDSWAYYTTNAPNIYMNADLRVDTGKIGSYNEDLELRTSGTTRIQVNNTTGNVGIGTTSPTYKLQVGNAGALADSIRIGSYDAVKNTRQYIGYTRQDTGLFETSTSGNTPSSVLPGVSGIRIVNTEGSVLSTKADQSIQLLTHIYNGSSRVALHANYDGNVGIGTTSPATKLDVNGVITATGGSFSAKVDFQGDAAIEGGSGYGVFKGYTGNDNHFIAVRGSVANTATTTITGAHQTTFVEHANEADEGWYFKSKTTGAYREIARIDGLNDMYLGGYKVWHAGNLTPLTIGTTSSTAMAGNTLSAQDLTDISNLSGTNTGDQDLSGYSTTSHNHDTRYPRGITKSYSSVDTDSEEDAWYKIFQTTDSGSTPVECHVRGYAHSSISFIVSEGYLGSGGHVQVLDYCLSTNSNYKWIKGVRIISNGDVELLLQGGSNVSLEMTVIGDASVVSQPELSSAAANTVKDTVVNPTTGMLRAKGVISGSNFSGSSSGTNTGDQVLPTLTSLGAAPLASPALTGTPTAPTAGATVNTTQLATTAFVQTAIANLSDSAPATLNTLNELAAALGDDASFSTTVTNSIAAKLPLAGGNLTGNLGINSSSPAAPLDVQPASDYKVTKVGDDRTSHYKFTGFADHTLTLSSGSYHSSEVVITAHQTNGGTNNNLYIRGIWTNNHTSHHWHEIENIGGLSGSTFTITNGQSGDTTNSGELEIVHDYVSGSFSQMVVRVTDHYGTHSYTIS